VCGNLEIWKSLGLASVILQLLRTGRENVKQREKNTQIIITIKYECTEKKRQEKREIEKLCLTTRNKKRRKSLHHHFLPVSCSFSFRSIKNNLFDRLIGSTTANPYFSQIQAYLVIVIAIDEHAFIIEDRKSTAAPAQTDP
jgi:hypothetical protein